MVAAPIASGRTRVHPAARVIHRGDEPRSQHSELTPSRASLATGFSRGRVISSRIVGRPDGLAERPVRLDDLLPIGRVVLLEDLVQVAEAIVGDRREEMMGDVHVLAVDEHGPSGEGVGEEDAGVGQAARVGVRMLVDVPQEHEEHEGRRQRDEPEQGEIHGRRPAGGPPKVREDLEQDREEPEADDARRAAAEYACRNGERNSAHSGKPIRRRRPPAPNLNSPAGISHPGCLTAVRTQVRR